MNRSPEATVLWEDLVAALQVPKGNNGICLPVGSCGLIHVRSRKTEIQVSNRRYLAHKLCPDPTCPTTSTSLFFKSTKSSAPQLQAVRSRRIRTEQADRLTRFCTQLTDAFLSESQKQRTSMQPAAAQQLPSEPALLATLNSLPYCCRCYCSHLTNPVTTPLPPPRRQRNPTPQPHTPTAAPDPQIPQADATTDTGDEEQEPGCWGELVYMLLVSGDIQTLTLLDRSGHLSIQRELTRNFGGQAVACGFNFLMLHHLLRLYVSSRAIIAAGLQGTPQAWGCMAPDSRWRQWLMTDCDYRTCVPSFRPALQEGVYMQDMAATTAMLQECFRVLSTFFMLKQTPRADLEWRVQGALTACYGFKFENAW